MKKIWKNEEGVSPVIAVILMVAITVVLAAVLYVMVSGMIGSTETTPKGSLYFNEDPDVVGKYYGQFQGTIKFDKIEISVLDASLGTTMIMRPDQTKTLSIPGGLNMTLLDTNDNDKLDGSDTILITGGSTGDKITIVYDPTGESVATASLP